MLLQRQDIQLLSVPGSELEGKTVLDDKKEKVDQLRKDLDFALMKVSEKELGDVLERDDISTTNPSPREFDRELVYPKVVVDAIAALVQETNGAFGSLVEKNEEGEEDYRFARNSEGEPFNVFVQVDMVGLPDEFLEKLGGEIPVDVVREVLRRRIFEIENSMAMLNLITAVGERNGVNTEFKKRFHAALDEVRKRHGKKIAILAVTEDKLESIRGAEFGKRVGDELLDEEVKKLSGFDTLMGPKEFKEYLAANDGKNDFVLYVRSSAPVSQLKKPKNVAMTILDDPEIRAIIKRDSITLNIDAPGMEFDRRINDTKEYMPDLGMGVEISTLDDLMSEPVIGFLREEGIDPSDHARMHFKPMKGAFGCYGHHSGVKNSKGRGNLRRDLRDRGAYIVQPKMRDSIVVDKVTGHEYMYIDRNFFFSDGEKVSFIGGMRNHMPIDSQEAKNSRVHGSDETVFLQILDGERR